LATRQDELRAGLSGFLTAKRGQDWQVDGGARIPGGASRETWRFVARRGDVSQGIIVRIDPETSLIDTDRRVEYAAIAAAFRSGIPAPEPLYLEEDLSWLGRPFTIATEVPGCAASADGFAPEHLDAIAEQKWRWLGKIAALDPASLGLDKVMPAPAPELCAMEQLEYWAGVIRQDEIHPNPVAEAAVRWLRRNPPPPPQKLSLVHGDYRTGNFLYNPQGQIKAILDWEMAHIGDPLEDLAWSLDPLWNFNNPALAGQLAPHSVAIAHWEKASGLKVDPEVFRWWRIFASVKGIGIWISSSEDYHRGAAKLPILAIAGWLMTDRQQRILCDYLSPHSPHIYPEVAQ
jgi:aminoglycoside phosphotransferase (APT) family kinase protein